MGKNAADRGGNDGGERRKREIDHVTCGLYVL